MRKNAFKFLEGYINHELENLAEYYNKILDFIRKEKMIIESDVPDTSNMDYEETQNILESIAEDQYLIEKIVETNFNKSIVLSYYTIVELRFKTICDYLKLYLKLTKDYKSEKGEGIEKSKKYITKYSKINISQDASLFLADLNRIRNALTHANGMINEIKDVKRKIALIKTINKGNGLYLSNNQREFIITSKYIEYIDSKIKTVVHEIILSINNSKEI